MNYTKLQCTSLHCTELHYTAVNYTTLQCTTLHCTASLVMFLLSLKPSCGSVVETVSRGQDVQYQWRPIWGEISKARICICVLSSSYFSSIRFPLQYHSTGTWVVLLPFELRAYTCWAGRPVAPRKSFLPSRKNSNNTKTLSTNIDGFQDMSNSGKIWLKLNDFQGEIFTTFRLLRGDKYFTNALKTVLNGVFPFSVSSHCKSSIRLRGYSVVTSYSGDCTQ